MAHWKNPSGILFQMPTMRSYEDIQRDRLLAGRIAIARVLLLLVALIPLLFVLGICTLMIVIDWAEAIKVRISRVLGYEGRK